MEVSLKKKKLKSPDVTWYQNPWKIDMKKISFNQAAGFQPTTTKKLLQTYSSRIFSANSRQPQKQPWQGFLNNRCSELYGQTP